MRVRHRTTAPSRPVEKLVLLFFVIGSEDAELRRAAIRCLRAWGEKDRSLVVRKNLERRLLDLVSSEEPPLSLRASLPAALFRLAVWPRICCCFRTR